MRNRIETTARTIRAFSLVELVLVAAIIAIVASIAVPRFSSSLAKQRADAAARRVVVDLQLAQRRTKISGTVQAVKFTSDAAYELIDMPHPDHPDSPYVVNLRDEPYRITNMTVNFAGSRDVAFDAYGVPDNGGSVIIRVGDWIRIVKVDAATGRATAQ